MAATTRGFHALGRDEYMWGMFSHLAALATLVIPHVGGILGPLVVWLIKRDESHFVDRQGKESLNFQISLLIFNGVCLGVAALTSFFLIGLLLLPVALILYVLGLILPVVAAVKANDGVDYRYPLTIRFLK